MTASVLLDISLVGFHFTLTLILIWETSKAGLYVHKTMPALLYWHKDMESLLWPSVCELLWLKCGD